MVMQVWFWKQVQEYFGEIVQFKLQVLIKITLQCLQHCVKNLKHLWYF